MVTRRFLFVAGAILAVALSASRVIPAETLPEKLTDEEFWRISSDFSERAGTFQSDNLLSNERWLQDVIPELTRLAKPHGVYVGVGPEQNFTYIAALKPRIAFIIDIRRGNLNLQLMYKALFELSADRAEFISRLFAKKRPEGLTATSTVKEIFDAYAQVESTDALYAENMRAIVNQLVKKHAFVLSSADTLRLQHIYTAMYAYGPTIQYSSTQNNGRRPNEPTYAELMVATDRDGQSRGYLSSEETFAYTKQLESDNLVVPIIGNFAGGKAIRSVGTYLKERGATISAFYLSNVEEYLRQDGLWRTFCGNAASLPFDVTSIFIRSVRSGVVPGYGLASQLGSMATDLKGCDAE